MSSSRLSLQVVSLGSFFFSSFDDVYDVMYVFLVVWHISPRSVIVCVLFFISGDMKVISPFGS